MAIPRLAFCLLSSALIASAWGDPADIPASGRVVWFEGRLQGGGAVALPGDRPLTAAEVKPAFDSLWADYKAAAVKLGWDKTLLSPSNFDRRALLKSISEKNGKVAPLALRAGVLPAGAETMPYVYLTQGPIPKGGRPLFVQMHGGGSTDEKLSGPHGWEVNTRDWQNQMPLCLLKFPEGLYFVPRMANDNKGRWWMKHNQDAYDTLFRRAVLFNDVNPDRIYLMGISEGAYGTEALTPFWADRLAGGCAMAGGAGGGERFYNLRNTALRNDTGEFDTMFGRRKLAEEAHAYLDNLKRGDKQGYDHFLNIQAGKGHGVDYAPGPEWLSKRVRNPRPSKVCWFNFALDGRRRRDFSWLSLSKEPPRDTLIIAEIDRAKNTVVVDARITPEEVKNESPVYATATMPPVAERAPYTGDTLTVSLDDRLLDLDRPVTVTVNGKVAFQGRVERRLALLAEDIARTGDPGRCFCARVSVAL